MKIREIFLNGIDDTVYLQRGVSYFTDNIETTELLISNGWKITSCDKNHRLVPPRVVLADLVDCTHAFQYGDYSINYLFFCYLEELINKDLLQQIIDKLILETPMYNEFACIVVTGAILDAEISIMGSDNRVFQLSNDLFNIFIEEKRIPNKPLSFISSKNNTAIHSLIGGCNYNILKKYLSEKRIDIIKKKYVSYNYIKDISSMKKEYDILLIVAEGAYKYIPEYIEKILFKCIVICDYHLWKKETLNSSCFSHGENDKIIDEKDIIAVFNGKTVLIMDSVYSGNTIEKVKQYISEKGAIVTTLGIFPKSLLSIMKLDYVQILHSTYLTKSLFVNKSLFKDLYHSNVFRSYD